MNIGNRTSVKSVDILDIEHRTAILDRYRFGSRRHLAAQRDNSAGLLTLGSANNNYCSARDRVKHACAAYMRLISMLDIPSHVRRQGASDHSMSEVA